MVLIDPPALQLPPIESIAGDFLSRQGRTGHPLSLQNLRANFRGPSAHTLVEDQKAARNSASHIGVQHPVDRHPGGAGNLLGSQAGTNTLPSASTSNTWYMITASFPGSHPTERGAPKK